MTRGKALGRPKQHREGKKNRKFGRNKVKCAEYRRKQKHERSHVRRIERHMKRYKDGSDTAREALARYQRLLK